jgi:hypothetical protein
VACPQPTQGAPGGGEKKKEGKSVGCRLSDCRLFQGAPKKRKKNDVPTYLPFLRFFEIFRSDFRKYFYGVFGLLMQRNGQKRYKTKSMGKDGRGKKNLNFFGQKLLTWTSPKKFFVVFLNYLPVTARDE